MNNWKNFKYRNLWQHPLWAAFQRSIGRQAWQIEAEGGSALVIKYPLPFGLSWLEVPRGPLFESNAAFNDLLEKIKSIADQQKSVFIRFSSYQPLPLQAPVTPFDHHPQTSLILELSKAGEEILAQMKPKGRYNIKVAEKHGIKVETNGDVESFYQLLKKTGERDGFGIHSADYYQKILAALSPHAQLLLARYDDRVIAGGIFVYLDEWGIYYYGASDHHYRHLMAPYLIQWTAMREAKKRGCNYYDFLGIAPENSPNHPWAGVTDFKKKFGGEVVNYPPAKDLVLRPLWYFLYKWRKR